MAVGHPSGADPVSGGRQGQPNLRRLSFHIPAAAPAATRFNVVLGRLTAGLKPYSPTLPIPRCCGSGGFTITNPILGTLFRHRLHQLRRLQSLPAPLWTAASDQMPELPCGSSAHIYQGQWGSVQLLPLQSAQRSTLRISNGAYQPCRCEPPYRQLVQGVPQRTRPTLDHFMRVKNIRWASSTQPGAVVFGGVLSSVNGATWFYPATLQCANTHCHGTTLRQQLEPSRTRPHRPAPFQGTHCDR
jgi:hypothetical protein